MTKYELSPEYTNVKSFYGKAVVTQEYNAPNEIITLYSYNTPVAIVVFEHIDTPRIYRTYDKYTATTQKHIKEFLLQNAWDYYNGTDITTKRSWSALPLYDPEQIKKMYMDL